MLKKINEKCRQFYDIVSRKRKEKKTKKAKKAKRAKLYNLPIFTISSAVKNRVKRIKDIKDKQNKLKLCKTMDVCPKCGKSLSIFAWNSGDGFHFEDYTIRYCKDCQKRFEQDADYYY